MEGRQVIRLQIGGTAVEIDGDATVRVVSGEMPESPTAGIPVEDRIRAPEASDILGIERCTVHSWGRRGRLRTLRLGRNLVWYDRRQCESMAAGGAA